MSKFNKNIIRALSVVLPVFNEEGNIKDVLNSIIIFFNKVKIQFEIIIIDDGSYDKTANMIEEFIKENKDKPIFFYGYEQNKGYGAALVKGIHISKYPWVLFMDADGQYKIQDIMKLVPYISRYDCIIGNRKVRKDPFYRLLLGRIYNYLIQKWFYLELKDINCGFKLFRKKIFENIQVKCKGALFYLEIMLKTKAEGWAIKEVGISHYLRRKNKQSGASMKVILRTFLEFFNVYNDLKFYKLIKK